MLFVTLVTFDVIWFRFIDFVRHTWFLGFRGATGALLSRLMSPEVKERKKNIILLKKNNKINKIIIINKKTNNNKLNKTPEPQQQH